MRLFVFPLILWSNIKGARTSSVCLLVLFIYSADLQILRHLTWYSVQIAQLYIFATLFFRGTKKREKKKKEVPKHYISGGITYLMHISNDFAFIYFER